MRFWWRISRSVFNAGAPLAAALTVAPAALTPPAAAGDDPLATCGARFSAGDGWRVDDSVIASDRLLLKGEGGLSAEARCLEVPALLPDAAAAAGADTLHLARWLSGEPAEGCEVVLFGRAASDAPGGAVLEVVEGCPAGARRARIWLGPPGAVLLIEGLQRGTEGAPRALWEPLIGRFTAADGGP
jgi:hypothetical protein